MIKLNLTVSDVARLVRVSEHTVRAWIKSPGSKSHNAMPDMAVELLFLKVGEPVPASLDE
jgi:DNA-binding transcriptional regulator YiaG